MGRTLLAVLAFTAVTPMPLLAYLDPISGSIILQVVAAAALGAALTAKRFWAWILARLRRITGVGE